MRDVPVERILDVLGDLIYGDDASPTPSPAAIARRKSRHEKIWITSMASLATRSTC